MSSAHDSDLRAAYHFYENQRRSVFSEFEQGFLLLKREGSTTLLPVGLFLKVWKTKILLKFQSSQNYFRLHISDDKKLIRILRSRSSKVR